jgi:hypothetical protein
MAEKNLSGTTPAAETTGVNSVEGTAIGATEGVTQEAASAPKETPEERAARIAAQLGYGSSVVGSSRIPFNENDAHPAVGLFLAQIDEVSVTTANYQEREGANSVFAGHQVPRLNIVWSNGNPDKSKAKYYTHSFNAVESNVDTFMGGKSAWKVRVVNQHLVHYLETYLMRAKGVPPIEVAEAISGRINDSIFPVVNGKTNYNGTPVYNLVPVEEVLEDYRRRFQAFADVMNYGVNAQGFIRKKEDADAKPLFKDANGKGIRTWILLLRSYKTDGTWKTNQGSQLAIPNFIRSGVMEIEVPGKQPILRLDKATMSLTAIETPKQTRVGAMPPVGGGGFIPMQAMPNIGSFNADASVATVGDGTDDLPF